jgi:uncharacterized protein YdaU (DUF1376 family)
MYPSDFEAKTSHLTLAEDGAYNRLLRICWMTPGCTMPADDAWIMRRARAHTDADKDIVRAVLSEFFTVENGRYSNAKLMQIWLASNEAHERRKNAGSKGGKAKALKTNKTASSNAVAMAKQPEPEPEPYKKEDTNVSLSASPDPTHANDISQAVSRFNDAAKRAGWPSVQKINPNRSKQLRLRLKDCGGLEGWDIALTKALDSDFCRGRTPKPWTGFGFDWLIKSANFTKLMEGNYDNRTCTTNGHDSRPDRPGAGMAQAFATVAARRSRGAEAGGGGGDSTF